MLDTQHGIRSMKIYPVTASDMRNIRMTGAYTSVAFSIAVAFLGYGLDIIFNAIFSDPLTSTQAKVAAYDLAPVLFFCAAIFCVGGIVAMCNKNATWREIETSTKHQNLSAGAE
jgi:hypothetical protein